MSIPFTPKYAQRILELSSAPQNFINADENRWTNLETALGAVSRIKTFNETTEVEHRPEENMPPPDYWPKNGQIEFRKVSAAYKLVFSSQYRIL